MHIMFMDIEMSDENGIDLAMEVNRKWPKCQVVYLTNYWSYAMEVYETRHVYYIVKEKFEKNCRVCWKGDRTAAETEQKSCSPVPRRCKSKSEAG